MENVWWCFFTESTIKIPWTLKVAVFIPCKYISALGQWQGKFSAHPITPQQKNTWVQASVAAWGHDNSPRWINVTAMWAPSGSMAYGPKKPPTWGWCLKFWGWPHGEFTSFPWTHEKTSFWLGEFAATLGTRELLQWNRESSTKKSPRIAWTAT